MPFPATLEPSGMVASISATNDLAEKLGRGQFNDVFDPDAGLAHLRPYEEIHFQGAGRGQELFADQAEGGLQAAAARVARAFTWPIRVTAWYIGPATSIPRQTWTVLATNRRDPEDWRITLASLRYLRPSIVAGLSDLPIPAATRLVFRWCRARGIQWTPDRSAAGEATWAQIQAARRGTSCGGGRPRQEHTR